MVETRRAAALRTALGSSTSLDTATQGTEPPPSSPQPSTMLGQSTPQSPTQASASTQGMSTTQTTSGTPTSPQPSTQPSPPIPNVLAGLSTDQLAAIFGAFASVHNTMAFTSPTPPAEPRDYPSRSHRASALSAMASSLPKLKEGSYTQWAFAVKDAIQSAGLLDYITGDIPRPSDTDSKALEKYIQETGAIRSAIVGALDHEVSYRYLDGTTTPKEAWDALKARYHVSDETMLSSVDDQLRSLKLDEGGNLVEHIAKFKRLIRDMDGTDYEVKAPRAIAWLWKSLPSSYDHYITLQRRSEERDFNKICIELETHYRSQLPSNSSEVSAYPASVSSHKLARDWNVPLDLRRLTLTGAKNPALATRARDACRDCLETGHRANTPQCNFTRYRIELWGPRIPQPNRPQKRGGIPSNSSQQANIAEAAEVAPGGQAKVVDANAADFPEYAAFAAVIEATTTPEVHALSAADESAFLLDSGCQSHMTCTRSVFTHLEKLKWPIRIRGIAGATVDADSKGTIALPVQRGGEIQWFYLHDVLYAPKLKRNLLSTGALMDDGLSVNLTPSGATVLSPEGSVRATATLKNRLWMLDVDQSIWAAQSSVQANIAVTGTTWHKRLGHASPKVLQKMADTGLIAKLTKKDLEMIAMCEACVLGKGTRLAFPDSTSVTSAPLEVLHSDLSGPFPPSVGGARYVMTLLDDFSRMAWICLLKTKDEAFGAFKLLRACLERATGLPVKTLRTDGGGEYTSHAMEKYLADAGIHHQTSCPNSSQQNGKAERLQRTIFDRARRMLAEADMSWGWWGEAIRNAVYIYNRVPHSALPNSSSPLSAWLRKPCNISDIRVFGSVCFAIDTSKHRKKSAPRAIKCRVLGRDLSSKAYRLQVHGTTKVIKSHDVIFHEDRHLSQPEVSLGAPYPVRVPGSVGANDSVGAEDSVGDENAGAANDSVGADDLEEAGAEKSTTSSGKTQRKLRRSARVQQRANLGATVDSNVASVPRSYKEAMRSNDAEGWNEALGAEYKSWHTKEVYEVTARPEDEEVLPVMVIFTSKTDPEGREIRKKARCVVIGSKQSPSTFDPVTNPSASPVAHMTTFRLMSSIAATKDLEFQQMDVNTAYLHAPINRPTYIAIPPGFPEKELQPGLPRGKQALRLKRAVYGLREAPHCWYAHCAGRFAAEGFKRSDNDHCLFSINAPGSDGLCHVLIYVDDFTLMTKTPEQMSWLKSKLSSMFDIKDLGAADQLLGMEVTRDRQARTLKLSQRKFTRRLLEEYGLLDGVPLTTPMQANALSTLPSHETPLTREEVEYMADKDYRHLLGCLNWLAQGTRPDIAYSVARLGQAQSNPHPGHWKALVHILRYLSGTIDMGLVYSATATDPAVHMFTDSAFADCPDTRKSHSGYVVIAGGAAVDWSSRKQPIVTTSSTEAEYVAMGYAAKEAIWICRVLEDFQSKMGDPLRIFADNQSSLLLAESEKLSNRTKHLDVQYHFVREQVKKGICRFHWIPTKLNTADVLTKPLGPALFTDMRPRLGLPRTSRQYGPDSEDETLNGSSKSRVGVLGDGVAGGELGVGGALDDRRT